ncbi:MAG TPA: hypothetical protein VFY20_09745 [Gemmatimonadales bacterium]|nr:hypothetical protein [Gemmatimonadales bacterium]
MARDGRVAPAVVSGAAGAVALTAIHQLARHRLEYPPRMDVLGKRALARLMRSAGWMPRDEQVLERNAFAGDLVANTAYYAAVSLAPRHPLRCGVLLGVAAGLGALLLPPVMGLGYPPHSNAWSNRVMTVAWYTLGGLVAGGTFAALGHDRDTTGRA